jgi:hypothetical protein
VRPEYNRPLMLPRIAAPVLAAWALALQPGQARPVSLVVTNGTVVTMDGGGRVLAAGAVAVEGREIVAVDAAMAGAASTATISRPLRGRTRRRRRSMPAAASSCPG